jgi:hypothetical protein
MIFMLVLFMRGGCVDGAKLACFRRRNRSRRSGIYPVRWLVLIAGIPDHDVLVFLAAGRLGDVGKNLAEFGGGEGD